MSQRTTGEAVCRWRALVFAAALLLVNGCSAAPGGDYPQPPIHGSPLAQAPLAGGGAAPVARVPEPTGVSYFGTASDSQRLENLWRERTQTKFSDFAIGPGDKITIALPDVKDLKDATVKVSAAGYIVLPMLGKIHASGMTQQQLRDEVRRRLLKFMYDPQFQLTVKQFQSRQVAVLGAVGRPGVITLNGASETILEAIGQAGGPIVTAADRVILIPANPSQTAPDPQTMAAAVAMVDSNSREHTDDGARPGTSANAPASVRPMRVTPIRATDGQMPVPRDSGSLADFAGINGSPVVMSLHSDSPDGSARFLNMPLRPGDVLVVPHAGRVAVVGWVNAPGSFEITSGFSVLSAIGAAGGPMYAADQTSIHLIRKTTAGTTKTISLNLDKIMRGKEPDVLVQGNDLIEVDYSTAKLIPYALYNLFQNKLWMAIPYVSYPY